MSKRQQLLFELITKEKEKAQQQKKEHADAQADSVSSTTKIKRRTTTLLQYNNYSSIILATVIIIVIFFCGYILGYHFGKRQAIAQRSEKQLADIQSQPPKTEVLKVTPVTVLPKEKTIVMPNNKPLTPEKFKKSGNKQKFSRKKGLNYLIIQLFRDLSSAERARKFLADNGVNATVEKLGRWYALTSVAGFDLRDIEGKRQAQAFREQIKALGRRYVRKKEANGVDFQTCFYRKWK